jgi:hypothetical protein
MKDEVLEDMIILPTDESPDHFLRLLSEMPPIKPIGDDGRSAFKSPLDSKAQELLMMECDAMRHSVEHHLSVVGGGVFKGDTVRSALQNLKLLSETMAMDGITEIFEGTKDMCSEVSFSVHRLNLELFHSHLLPPTPHRPSPAGFGSSVTVADARK